MQDYNISKIASALGVSHTTVSKWRNEAIQDDAGITPIIRGKSTFYSLTDVETILQYSNDSNMYQRFAKEFDIPLEGNENDDPGIIDAEYSLVPYQEVRANQLTLANHQANYINEPDQNLVALNAQIQQQLEAIQEEALEQKRRLAQQQQLRETLENLRILEDARKNTVSADEIQQTDAENLAIKSQILEAVKKLSNGV